MISKSDECSAENQESNVIGSEVGLMLDYKEMIVMKWKFEPCTYLEDEYSR